MTGDATVVAAEWSRQSDCSRVVAPERLRWSGFVEAEVYNSPCYDKITSVIITSVNITGFNLTGVILLRNISRGGVGSAQEAYAILHADAKIKK